MVRETVGGLAIDRLPIPGSTDRASYLGAVRHRGLCRRPYLDSPLFHIRIVRPGVETDNSPPHRDAWLDHLRNCVNIYVPIAGSNARSALPLAPGSHLWKESEIERTRQEGALIGGQSYRVPSVTGAVRSIRMVRPNLGPNELTLFSPYLVHGGGDQFESGHDAGVASRCASGVARTGSVLLTDIRHLNLSPLPWRAFVSAVPDDPDCRCLWSILHPLHLGQRRRVLRLAVEGRTYPGEPPTGYLVFTHSRLRMDRRGPPTRAPGSVRLGRADHGASGVGPAALFALTWHAFRRSV